MLWKAKFFQVIHRLSFTADLATISCWVREMSDDDAYMALALNDAQAELSPLMVRRPMRVILQRTTAAETAIGSGGHLSRLRNSSIR
jgi:hypothetical protein